MTGFIIYTNYIIKHLGLLAVDFVIFADTSLLSNLLLAGKALFSTMDQHAQTQIYTEDD